MNTNAYVGETIDEVAREAASWIAERLAARLKRKPDATLAVSGGRTPWIMLRHLALLPVEWSRVHIFQVDERLAPLGHEDRNLTHLGAALSSSPRAELFRVHPMPVEASDLVRAAEDYAHAMELLAGRPPRLDVIHLGLGADGHTASLVPNDPVLKVNDRDIAMAEPYQGRRRMTLTYRAIERCEHLVWVVTGADKREALNRLVTGDRSIPAGCVRHGHSVFFVDRAAAGA